MIRKATNILFGRLFPTGKLLDIRNHFRRAIGRPKPLPKSYRAPEATPKSYRAPEATSGALCYQLLVPKSCRTSGATSVELLDFMWLCAVLCRVTKQSNTYFCSQSKCSPQKVEQGNGERWGFFFLSSEWRSSNAFVIHISCACVCLEVRSN